MLWVNEIFYSIQGESCWAGVPTLFVRLTGCNLRCDYCDTTHSYEEGSPKEVGELVDYIHDRLARTSPSPFVCITGGEPLLQKEAIQLMRELDQRKIRISLETNGSCSLAKVPLAVKVVVDVKTPDSGAKDSFLMENLNFLQPHHDIKFVIHSHRDFDWAEDFCYTHNLWQGHRGTVLYSPSFGVIPPEDLADRILKAASPARLQLQLHKYIWPHKDRGV